MANVLIIDDDLEMSEMLSGVVQGLGYHEVRCASTLKDGLETAFSRPFDVIFLDVGLPDGNGLDILPEIQQTPSCPEVIIITGAGDANGAELAIKNGAWDYIEKPSSIKAMTLPLVRALQFRQEKKTNKKPVNIKRDGIVGNSPKMNACLDLLAQAAYSEANVLITGETGTGKELFAGAIHKNSCRAGKNFVVVDCTALPETLIESMLFGHEKGAFTGADKAREGLITQADGGTLFLDEVGELPLSIQKTFLRVLEERRFRPLGAKREIKSDFRLMAATNRDLDQMVEQVSFRNDLLFRLKSFTIELPSLRERPEDIKELTMYHLDKLYQRNGIRPKGFSPEFFETLASYDWPGNIRELVNTLERTLAIAGSDPTLFSKHLPTIIRIRATKASLSTTVLDQRSLNEISAPSGTFFNMQDFREIMDQKYLQSLMSRTKGKIKESCRISGLSRSRLYALLKKHQIPPLR